ncbi:MAG: hypothetical protein Q4B28_03465 [bacterium]|nr:hypothetical protein [bacterium]
MMDISQHASKLALNKGTISFWAKVENDRTNAILAWSENQNTNFKALTL